MCSKRMARRCRKVSPLCVSRPVFALMGFLWHDMSQFILLFYRKREKVAGFHLLISVSLQRRFLMFSIPHPYPGDCALCIFNQDGRVGYVHDKIGTSAVVMGDRLV